MGMVTMTCWSISQKKVARNKCVEVGYKFFMPESNKSKQQ